jgi:hypothetical protein
MRKRVALLIAVLALSLSLCAYAAAEEEGVPSIDEKMFKDAKQTLVYFDAGDYESASALVAFADADELQKFVEGNFTTIGSGVQSEVSVAYWTGSTWELAVPVAEPSEEDVEALILLTSDGTSFSGYSYATWGDVEAGYEACDYVVWNEEYIPNAPHIVEDN